MGITCSSDEVFAFEKFFIPCVLCYALRAVTRGNMDDGTNGYDRRFSCSGAQLMKGLVTTGWLIGASKS